MDFGAEKWGGCVACWSEPEEESTVCVFVVALKAFPLPVFIEQAIFLSMQSLSSLQSTETQQT